MADVCPSRPMAPYLFERGMGYTAPLLIADFSGPKDSGLSAPTIEQSSAAISENNFVTISLRSLGYIPKYTAITVQGLVCNRCGRDPYSQCLLRLVKVTSELSPTTNVSSLIFAETMSRVSQFPPNLFTLLVLEDLPGDSDLKIEMSILNNECGQDPTVEVWITARAPPLASQAENIAVRKQMILGKGIKQPLLINYFSKMMVWQSSVGSGAANNIS